MKNVLDGQQHTHDNTWMCGCHDKEKDKHDCLYKDPWNMMSALDQLIWLSMTAWDKSKCIKVGTRRGVWRTHQLKQQEACMWHIEWCRNEGDSFFKRIVAGDYTWMHHCKLESKWNEYIWNIWNWRDSRPNHLLVSWCWLLSGILPCPCPLIFSGNEKQLTVSGIMKHYEKSWSQLLNPRETREAMYV
jgi:hypothetical protein